ncbi:nephrin-like isoform X2 [Ischnura elegans]|uniref:nephrin-like isoform X2 n=1 Tax=Ischnura elegans TaxID=197161 RepID=UPI001ED8A7ED|nr:nephrin-like isoform X2 [Ischnura elegans]
MQQQYFRVRPKDVRVQEGGEAVLECEIGHLAGSVQWTKDGFALGFKSEISGYRNYRMMTDRQSGVFNLRITNATLSDDAEFSCQALPSGPNKPIRADARLTVIAPPSAVEIVGHVPNEKIEIREGTPLTLECVVYNSRPPATIEWYRGRVPLKIESGEGSAQPEENPEGEGHRIAKRYNITSRITYTPTADDDFADFSCQAKHEALAPDMPMRTSVQLSVLYPPGPPYIEGYTAGETFRRGQSVELVCRSRGGNPPAQLVWWRGKEILRSTYRTIGRGGPRISENALTLEAQDSDDGAVLRCEASNTMVHNLPGGPKPKMTAEVKLTVHFAPTHVTITGPTEARVGESVPLTCITGASNPAADIKWTVGGRQLKNFTSRTIPANSPDAAALNFYPGRSQRREGKDSKKDNNDTEEDDDADRGRPGRASGGESHGGWITVSNITANVTGSHRRSLVVICHGLNMQLTEVVVGTHTINILYPPSQPMIHGYTEGVPIEAGSIQRISCVSSGGNPPATISWFKNGKKVRSMTRVTDTSVSVSGEVTIATNASDNNAVYRCEASNSATEVPLSESIKLTVHFPPENVKIRTEPARLRTGQEARLTCESSSSNPPARLTWWRDGIPIPQDLQGGLESDGNSPANGTTIITSGLDGGHVSKSVLYLGEAGPALAGASFACQASNEALDKSVHDTIILQILYKPKFLEPAEGDRSVIVVAEGESTNVTLLAEGNPPDITYTWTKDGAPLKSSRDGVGRQRVTWDGPTLNVTDARREDAGRYTVEAVNSEGSDTTSIKVDVHYPPTIHDLPRHVVVAKDEEAILTCTADGNPLPEGSVHWRREGSISSGGGPAISWALIPPGGTVSPHEGEGRIIPMFHSNGTSILKIQTAESKDAGVYVCVASNGVGKGPAVSKSTFLIVKHAPEMDQTSGVWKAATTVGGVARLVCVARGAPKPSFSWSYNGANILPSSSTSSGSSSTTSPQATTGDGSPEKYKIQFREIDPSTWESVLAVRGVRQSDYGTYKCGASNEFGSITANVNLSPASRPDPPVSLSLKNASHDSVLLSWTPGFDGGAHVVYRIRYKKVASARRSGSVPEKMEESNGGETLATTDDRSSKKKPVDDEDLLSGGSYYYVDVSPPSATAFVVTGLAPATEYAFSIMAKNRLGSSDYSGPPLRVVTSSNNEHERMLIAEDLLQKADLHRIIIISGSVAGTLVLALNIVALVVCFFRRKRSKRMEEAAASEQGSSKSATIEMYASSYNETVTGETLSSISEKSESYSNGGDSNEDYIEDSTKPAASTYLIDQIEPPSQYAYHAPPSGTMHHHTHPHPHHHHHHHMHAPHGRPQLPPQQIPGDGTLSRRKPPKTSYLVHTPMDSQGPVDGTTVGMDHPSVDRNEDDINAGNTFVDTLRRNPYGPAMGGVMPPPMSDQQQAYYGSLSPDSHYTANLTTTVYPPAPLGFGPTPPMSATSSAPTSLAPPLVVVGNGSLPPDVTMMAPYPYLGSGQSYSAKGTLPRSGPRPSPIGPTPPSSSASSSPPPPPPPPLPALSTFSPSSVVVGGGPSPDMEGHLV